MLERAEERAGSARRAYHRERSVQRSDPPPRLSIIALADLARALLARGWASLVVIAGVVLLQRLALPLSVIWLGEEGAKVAALALFGAAAMSFVRARAADRLARVVRLNVLELYLRPFELGPATSLPQAEIVSARLAVALPTLVGWAVEGVAVVIAAAAAVPIVAALIASELGIFALVPLGVAGAVGASVTMAMSPRVERAWGRAWDRSRSLLEAIDAGYRGAVDLRAHGRARRYSDRLRTEASAWSDAEGRARALSAVSSWGALVATLFAALGSSAIFTPDLGAGATKDGIYRAFMLVLAAVPTLQTLVGGIATALYARDELAAIEGQRAIADRASDATAAEVDEPIDTKAEIRLCDVDFTYPSAAEGGARSEDRAAALRGASLVLGERESLVITGPNGAGKTTLLYVLLGIVRPDAGRVLVGGREVRLDNPRWRERVALLSQRPFELRDASVAENMRAFDADVPDDRLIAALSDVGLWSALRARASSDAAALDRPYAELSRGQSRRVMLARALLRDADLLFLDEPEAHLDAESVRAIAEVLAKIARDRRVIAVVHDPAICAFTSRVVTLSPPDRA